MIEVNAPFPAALSRIITSRGCKSCRFARRAEAGHIECRFGPPTSFPMFGPTPGGGVAVVNVITLFPHMQPDQDCEQYAAGVAKVAG